MKERQAALKSLALAIAAAIAVTASHASAQNAAISRGAKYVALGSSFAAGPGVADRAPESAPACAQSGSNYAHLLAAKRGLQLVDKTCSGATTTDILTDHQFGLQPQIEAVDAETRLVTITIGGNNLGYLGNLGATSCAHLQKSAPAMSAPRVCRPVPDSTVQAGAATLPQSMREVIAAVRGRAPRAIIVLVNYVGILPAKGSCPARAPLNEQEMQNANRIAESLAKITADTANATHIKLLDAAKLSEGHDVCSSDPWIFPFDDSTAPAAFAPASYHPNLKAMQAIAGELDRMLP